MTIAENISLKKQNTFGIEANARYFTEISSEEEFLELKEWKHFERCEKLILGGGSNILLTKDFDGLVIKNNFKGIGIIDEDASNYIIEAGAGENWHKFVMHCVEKDYAGIENLSLIPGNVGASPMQNIGAYGVEIKDVFHNLDALEITTGESVRFTANDCRFGYRDSVFKNKLKNQFIITTVSLKLNKVHVYNTTYGAIEEELHKMNVDELSIQAISKAVINIRRSKLPDPAKIGNAGSFFKNPVVSMEKYEEIRKNYPNLAAYKVDDNSMKLAAGWLIETCGWKGKSYGNYGVHAKQALVLVNYGDAKGEEIFELSEKILKSVEEKFGITLEREVNII